MRLMRQMGNASPQPMLSNLAEEGLAFDYYSAEGNVLRPADGALRSEDLDKIHRIDIYLSVELSHPYGRETGPIRCRRTATVTLRNGQ